eukprot:scaffold335160_cov17-Prasinocladus_malaysianus.AAC.1
MTQAGPFVVIHQFQLCSQSNHRGTCKDLLLLLRCQAASACIIPRIHEDIRALPKMNQSNSRMGISHHSPTSFIHATIRAKTVDHLLP